MKFLSQMKRTLTLNKFDYDYMLDFHYKVSTQKFCSTYILIDSKILHTCIPYLIQWLQGCHQKPVASEIGRLLLNFSPATFKSQLGFKVAGDS